MAGSPTLTDIADELYAIAPEDFTAARDAAVRDARDRGERELAAEVKQLRRPSIGAWLVNQLVHRQADRLDELLDLGGALREAQDALDGAELRAMSRQRHQIIRALSDAARALAAEAGHRVGDAAQRELEATLDAALADEQAADAVRSGRLMRALSSTGIEAVDLTDAVAAPGETSASKRRPRKKTATATRNEPKQAAEKRAAAKQQAVQDARAELERAREALSEREAELAAARAAADDARKQVAELDAALAQAHEQQSVADKARREADQAVKSAARARDAAQRGLDTAEKKRAR